VRLSYDNHYHYDPPAEVMVGGAIDKLPLMFGRFDFRAVSEIPRGADCAVVIDKGEKRRPSLAHIAERCRRAIVIACPGDGKFRLAPDEIPPNVVRVFTTNRMHEDPRVVSMPLGVKSRNLNLLRYARREKPADHRDRALLYVNFATALPWRKRLAENFASRSWVTLKVQAESLGTSAVDDQVDYYRDMQNHKFVLSPPGNGIDCYRHWEALNLKAIPIVQRSRHMEAFSDLPILFTDDYSEITEEYLNQAYSQMSDRIYDFSSLYAEHYIQMLFEDLHGLSNPAFYLLDLWGMQWSAIDRLKWLSRTLSPYSAAETDAVTYGRPPAYAHPEAVKAAARAEARRAARRLARRAKEAAGT
jgi:hypothetical protein